jgi:hypothetical protein
VGSGNTYNTPVLTNDATYWVSATTEHAGVSAYGGRINNTANGQYHTNADNFQLFTAFQDLVIRSVKVYANGAAARTIAVVSQATGATVATGTFTIPNGESRVELNFAVPAGGPYGLRVVGGNPQLWRDGAGSIQSYPYAMGTLGSMTGTTATGSNATAFYYFFYDIEVSTPVINCSGPRTEVQVSVGPTGVGSAESTLGLRLWPNPTNGLVNIAWGEVQGQVSIDVLDLTGRLVLARNAAATGDLLTIDLSTLAAGDYTLSVRHAAGKSVHRVVVQ